MPKVQEGAGRSLCAGLTCCLSLPQLLNPPTKMSCQQNQQQCQPPPKCVPKCPTPKCPPKCPPVSSCCDVSSGGCCGPSSGDCCSSGCGGCCLSHHRRRRSHHCRPHRSDCCSQPLGGSGCCGGGSGQSYGGGCC